jgi:Mg2+/Co2+ transporter CorB
VKVSHVSQDVLSHEELRSVVYESGLHISHDYHRMLLSIFDLEKISIEHIMVPKNEIIGIDISDDWESILLQLTNSQHTRLPVYEGKFENLKGVLHVRVALNLIANHNFSKQNLLAQMEDILYVPENTLLNKQLLEFKRHRKRLSFVVDEYGEILGLVTLEDILEEIVGEFTTDFATSMSQAIHPQDDGSYIVDGTMTIRDLNREMKWHFPTDGAKTLSGLIIELFQDIPPAHMSLQIKDYFVEILQVKDNTVKSAKISLDN